MVALVILTLPRRVELVCVSHRIEGCKVRAHHARARALDWRTVHGVLVASLDEGDLTITGQWVGASKCAGVAALRPCGCRTLRRLRRWLRLRLRLRLRL
eukprot:7378869-Prymnesium_polylepis.3